jgi:hypothetical protein
VTQPIVTVTTGPSSNQVISLATVKTELGIGDSSQDTKLTRLIKAASAAFAGAAGLRREPWRQTYSIQLPGQGGQFLNLPAWPIESISSILLGTDTVTASSYSIAEDERSRIYASDGWVLTSVNQPVGMTIAGDEDLDYTVACVAGWLMESEVTTWAAATAYGGSGEPLWVRASDSSVVVLFEATTAGTSDATEPTWDTTVGNTTADNTVTWTARAAHEMPLDLQEAALGTVINWFRSSPAAMPSGISEVRIDSASVRFDGSGNGSASLPKFAEATLRQYR